MVFFPSSYFYIFVRGFSEITVIFTHLFETTEELIVSLSPWGSLAYCEVYCRVSCFGHYVKEPPMLVFLHLSSWKPQIVLEIYLKTFKISCLEAVGLVFSLLELNRGKELKEYIPGNVSGIQNSLGVVSTLTYAMVFYIHTW